MSATGAGGRRTRRARACGAAGGRDVLEQWPRGRLTAFDVAEIAQHAHPAVGVLDQEFVAPVLQRQHPAAGFDHESGAPVRSSTAVRCCATANQNASWTGWASDSSGRVAGSTVAPIGSCVAAPAGSPWWGRCGWRPTGTRRPACPQPRGGPACASGTARPQRCGLLRRIGGGRHDGGSRFCRQRTGPAAGAGGSTTPAARFGGTAAGLGAADWRSLLGAAGWRRCRRRGGSRGAGGWGSRPRSARLRGRRRRTTRAAAAAWAADWPPESCASPSRRGAGRLPGAFSSAGRLRSLGCIGACGRAPRNRGPQHGPELRPGPGSLRRRRGSGGPARWRRRAPGRPRGPPTCWARTRLRRRGRRKRRRRRPPRSRTGLRTANRSASSFRADAARYKQCGHDHRQEIPRPRKNRLPRFHRL